MKTRVRISAALLAALLAALMLFSAACVYDGPPEDDGTEAPAPHEGTFTSEFGTLIFAGDGRSVTVSFGEELSSITGLPDGEGTYAFMAETPPHRYEYRWDRANEFDLTVGGITYTFSNYMGGTSESVIKLYTVVEGEVQDFTFTK